MRDYGGIQIAGLDTATPLNLDKRLRIIEPFLQKESTYLLDCGCGAGDYVFALVDRYQIHAVGVDHSADKVALAHQHPLGRNSIQQGDLSAIPFRSQSFDAVLLNEVLEHVPDERRVLLEIRRVLHRGGRLFVFSPNRWFPFETHGVELKWSGKKVPPYIPAIPYIPLPIGRQIFNYWARNYWHHELRELLTTSGFQIESTTFIWQTFENISGTQPRWMALCRPWLRTISSALEKTPLLRAFGVSQVVIAQTL
jgi:ubiquinone/menaquinone biosynthesis C-methylase UbiE